MAAERGGGYSVAFSGGGALGAWEVGCLRAIVEKRGGLPHAVAGASAGALNAAAVAMGLGLDQLETEWRTLKSRDVHRPRHLSVALLAAAARGTASSVTRLSLREGFDNVSALFNTGPFRKTLERIFAPHMTTWPSLTANLALSVSDLVSRQRRYLYRAQSDFSPPNDLWREIPTVSALLDALLASAAIPLAFPPVTGLADGGIFRKHPLGPCLIPGFGDGPVFVLIPSERQPPLVRGLSSTLSALVAGWMFAGLHVQIEVTRARYRRARDSGISRQPICFIFTRRDLRRSLGVGMLSFGRRVCDVIQAGRADATQAMEEFDPDDEKTWF